MPANPVPAPVFGSTTLSNLLQTSAVGFNWSEGFHIYCELRPKIALEIGEGDERALKFVQVIEEYTNHGINTAEPFRIVLLELQGTVLHFYFEESLTRDTIIKAIQFSYIFTSALYEELRSDLGSEWDGFATCIDYGPAIIVRHESAGVASVVSLGPAANRPAKRLLYGRTPAGCVDVPGRWAKEFGKTESGAWFTINLLNRDQFPFINQMDDVVLRRDLLDRVRRFRADQKRPRISSLEKANKFNGFCVQADLDGFSAVVDQAFSSGAKAVEATAIGFKQILEFGDHMRNSTPGTIGLPWAGDRAPTLVSKNIWFTFSMRWQGYDAGAAHGKSWATLFKNVAWSIGGCHGRTGTNILVPIQAQGRRFLVAGGWPVATSLDAQNLGTGGDVVTHNADYANLDAPTRSLFSKITNTEFWKTKEPTPDKLKKAAVDQGKTNPRTGADYLSKIASVTIPAPRPHSW